MKKIILLIFVTVFAGCEFTTGTALITGAKRKPISPSDVIIYEQLLEQDQYEIIGNVTAESPVAFSKQAAKDRAFKELKVKAAEIGANGVIEVYFKDERKMIKATGKAIYVYE